MSLSVSLLDVFLVIRLGLWVLGDEGHARCELLFLSQSIKTVYVYVLRLHINYC